MGFIPPVPEAVNAKNPTLYYLTEGRRTEPDYMKNFKSCHPECRYSFKHISKSFFDIDLTERADLVELAYGIFSYDVKHKLTPFYLTKLILDDFYIYWSENIKKDIEAEVNNNISYNPSQDTEWYEKNNNLISPEKIRLQLITNEVNSKFEKPNKDIIKKLNQLRNRVVNTIKDKYLDDEGFIKHVDKTRPTSLDGVFEYIVEMERQEFKDNPYFQRFNPEGFELCEHDSVDFIPGDRVFLIFDRDYDPHKNAFESDEKFRGVLKQVEQCDFEALVSTPAFEIWLLMHHNNTECYKYGSGTVYLEMINDKLGELEHYSGVQKTISRTRFKTYYEKEFKHAVQESISNGLSTDLDALVNHAGTNVGVKLASLLENKNDN